MFLDDLRTSNKNKKLFKLSESLNKDFGVDISIYETLNAEEVVLFLADLNDKKAQIMLESSFNSYYDDPDYTRIILLSEALRIMLREIHPKRSPRNKKSNDIKETVEQTSETLNYKVHTPTGSVVDHDIDEDTPRPDLYWRKDQWEDEQRGENYPVVATDAPETGEAYSTEWDDNNQTPEQLNQKHGAMDAYAPNSQPVGGTHENEQQAGVYVAVMNPNRFLGDKDVNIMSIEPVVNSQNEVSPLSRKVSRIMVDADEQTNEDVDDMTTNIDIIKGLSGLLESSLLNENELQRAEIVFAITDLVMRMGKMIEDLSKIGTDDIMPLVDGLRDNFGASVAERFSKDAEVKLQEAANGIDGMKQMLDTYREKFESRISDEDSQQPIDLSAVNGGEMGAEMPAEEPGLGDLGGEEIGGLDDLGAEEETVDEPLGRALKETHIISIGGKKVKLTMEQIAILHKAKLLTEKLNVLNTAAMIDIPTTTFLNIKGKKIKITESQLKALIFAKNFKKRVDEKRANTVKLSETQAKMLFIAKQLTEKVSILLEEKPSAGLSAKKKSEVVKKAKKGGDIGKKGKGFEKVKKAAAAGGARDPEAVAAAAMWKNI